ncbi:MAG: hypothetical protein AB7G40_18630 [Hyphomonadaceae bacterium]
MSKKRDLLSAGARAALTVALGAAAAITATPAMAQDEDDTIVVTATRRDQALQEVPVAVTPVTAEMIENSGIRDVRWAPATSTIAMASPTAPMRKTSKITARRRSSIGKPAPER